MYAHYTAISKKNPEHRLRSLAEGELVRFNLVQGSKGAEAADITSIDGEPVQGSEYAHPRPNQGSASSNKNTSRGGSGGARSVGRSMRGGSSAPRRGQRGGNHNNNASFDSNQVRNDYTGEEQNYNHQQHQQQQQPRRPANQRRGNNQAGAFRSGRGRDQNQYANDASGNNPPPFMNRN